MSVVIIFGLIAFNIFGGRSGARIDESLAKAIAVLPFHNLTGDSNQDFISLGITDEIISHLYKVESFDEVRSYTSVRNYRDPERNITEIAEELEVNYILEGTYKRMGDELKITAQLIEPKSDDHIWLQDYKLPYNEIIGIPGEIALQIADHLKVFIKSEEKERIENEPTANIEAYNLYLQGRYLRNQGGKDNFDKSIEYYKRALEIDPNYALAYSGMAATYTSYAWGGTLPRSDFLPQAITYAKKALEIDNTLGEAHAELADALVVNNWDWTGGEKEFKRALELNPNYAMAHNRYAWLLSFVGRLDEAIKESKRAHELDPLSIGIWSTIGNMYYFARDYDRAIEEYRKVLEMYPNSGAQVSIALALSAKGLHNEAIEECLKIDFKDWNIGYIYGVAGKKKEAQEILDYYLELSKKEFVAPAFIAFIYIGLGEKDKAFEWLEKTYEQREGWVDLLKAAPMYDSLRSDPRFQDLVERMNFPE
ncbi:MAG: FlgO family outer membrane protein [Anaerolineales bacterium]|nr:FlgO family outer membrane protein [Anaerolineales bacterium]